METGRKKCKCKSAVGTLQNGATESTEEGTIGSSRSRNLSSLNQQFKAPSTAMMVVYVVSEDGNGCEILRRTIRTAWEPRNSTGSRYEKTDVLTLYPRGNTSPLWDANTLFSQAQNTGHTRVEASLSVGVD